MALILDKNDFVPKSQIPEAQKILPLKEIKGDADNFLSIVKTAQDIFSTFERGVNGLKDIMNLRASMQGNGIKSATSPQLAQIGNNSLPPARTETKEIIKEVKIMQKPRLNKIVFKNFLKELLEVKAKNLPATYKQLTLDEITGDNLKEFKVNFAGLIIPADKLLDLITDEFGKGLNNFLEFEQ